MGITKSEQCSFNIEILINYIVGINQTICFTYLEIRRSNNEYFN
jgi:hypothetical protein